MFSTLSKREVIILPTLNLPSANAFDLFEAKIFSLGKELCKVFISLATVRCFANGNVESS